jgi:hypothetical protein
VVAIERFVERRVDDVEPRNPAEREPREPKRRLRRGEIGMPRGVAGERREREAWTVVALIGIRTVVIPREEAALVAKFGADYVQYRERTGALLPKLGQKGT